MAKSPEVDAAAASEGAEIGAVPARRRSRKTIVIGSAVALALVGALGAGGYFAAPTALAMIGWTDDAAVAHAPEAQADELAQDVAAAGAEGEATAIGENGEAVAVALLPPLPVSKIVSRVAAATDYQIVSIYGGEAYLATPDNLIRIKVGSSAPGIGDILSITASESGGTIVGSLATLKTT
ncbi:hypothetical protein [Aureimonas sp. Leaf454]|uniref:hypothetical protein n=1 Tax=Aureimonas sp. Leaf454 TaxID=1736381 RepID=UPI0012E374EC|nr:hypothetical protein [Aureimonas sp. Leaf454]